MSNITRDTEELIDRALREDLATGDPTTEILIPADLEGTATFISKSPGVIAGVNVALEVFRKIDSSILASVLEKDGTKIDSDIPIAEVRGAIGSILKAERTALNFLRRLSGVASETAKYVEKVKGHDVRIVDTRKTTPGLRALEKYAVRAGGGHNHRQNLGDGILIKDNHIEALAQFGMSFGDVIRKANSEKSHTINVEVEVETLTQVKEALDAGATILLLDNMSIEDMKEAVKLCSGRAVTEASGTITLAKVQAVAETGVDLISVGALTHSSASLDISLDIR